MSYQEVVYWILASLGIVVVVAKTFANKFYDKTTFEGKDYYSYDGDSKLIPIIYWILNWTGVLLVFGLIGFGSYVMNQ